MLSVLSGLAPVVLHTVVLYLFLILALRLVGKRQISEIALSELVIMMALGSAVETSMVAKNTSLIAGLVSAGTLLITNRLVSFLIEHSHFLQRLMVGRPVPVVYNGKFLKQRIKKMGMGEDDIMEGIRQRGYDDVKQVRLAMLEIDGEISVLPKEDSKESGS